MKDSDGNLLVAGDKVIFYSARRKNKMRATIQEYIAGEMVSVLVDGDPFPVNVSVKQLKKSLQNDSERVSSRSAKEGETPNMAVATKKTTTKELRLKAKELGVDEWESLARTDLIRAMKRIQVNGGPSKRTTAAEKAAKRERIEQRAAERTAAPAKKTTKAAKVVKKAAASTEASTAGATGENPFRAGSNSWRMAEELLQGGRRKDMVKRLKRQIDLHPYTRKAKDLDVDFELDKRLMLTAQAMVKNHGFTLERDGRGLEGTIKLSKAARKTKRSAKK